MSEWQEYKLGDLVTFQRGHDLPREEMKNGIYPVAGSNSIIGYHNKFTSDFPGITIGRSGNIGNPQFHKTKFWAHNTTLYVKEFKCVDPSFFFYLLKTLDFSQLNSGSAVPSLNRNFIHPFKVKVPSSLPTQSAIAEILSSLDDKIELNNKINQELENLAQTLFKRWFIDFEFPNENGEPYKSSGGEMVESELGEIPKGWEVSEIGLVAKLGAGGDKPSRISEVQTQEFNIPIYSNGISQDGLYGYTDEAKIFEESVTISARGTIGFVCLRTTPFVPIVRLISVIADEKFLSTKFLYMWLKNQSIVGNGTTQQQLTVPDFKSSKITIPQLSVVNAFSKQMDLIVETINFNKKDIQELTNLRDTLLPKLISGELEVNNINF